MMRLHKENNNFLPPQILRTKSLVSQRSFICVTFVVLRFLIHNQPNFDLVQRVSVLSLSLAHFNVSELEIMNGEVKCEAAVGERENGKPWLKENFLP
jgi:hypothetical protein